MNEIRIAVIGVGHLGRHHARIYNSIPGVKLVGVADSSAARCAEIAAQCGVAAYEDFRALIPLVDAVSIVVPTFAHHAVASAFLNAGKSVLVEKPLASELWQANELVELARRRGAILQVGHIERFNPVFKALPDRSDPPRLIEARRVGPYSFRSTDISVVFDLMIHDLDIVRAVMGESPDRVTAAAWSVFGGHEDVAVAELSFPCGSVAHLTASRAAIAPSRTMTIWWNDSVAELDFATQRTVTSKPTHEFASARSLFVSPPPQQVQSLQNSRSRYFSVQEQNWSGGPELLALELGDFVACVRERSRPLVDGQCGRDAMELASAVVEAARRHPEAVLLPMVRPAALAA